MHAESLQNRAIPDRLQHDLSILFIGFNPSLKSAQTGHHYANPSNRFWKILYLAGLTERLYCSEEDDDLLAKGFGFTNIVARPTRSADEIDKEEFRQGRRQLLQKIVKYRPRVACYVGKGVYLQASESNKAQWGFQDEPLVEGVMDFVAPSSSGLVRMRVEEVAEIYRELREAITV